VSDLDDQKQPWPKKGQTLFCSAKDGWNSACLNWQADNFEPMCAGYLLSAELLIDHVVATHRDQDLLVYPIIFQYRHYIELRLKQLVALGRGLTGDRGKEAWGHSLLELWKMVRPLLEKIEAHGPKEDLEAVEEIVNQFDQVDRTGESFRYAQDTKGKNPLAGITHINLRNLRDVMKGITAFFEGATMQLSVFLENMAEGRAAECKAVLEARAEYESEMRAEAERDARE
jgi:hypothetical protein